MITLRLTKPQAKEVTAALDEALALLADGYREWMDEGGDPLDHPWIRIAGAYATLEIAIKERKAA